MNARFLFAAIAAVLLMTSPVLAAVRISSDPTQNMTCSGGVCAATNQAAVLNTTDLANMLATGDVKVVTGGGATIIGVTSPLTWTSANRLTLVAACRIHIRAQIMVAGGGGLTLGHLPALTKQSCLDDASGQLARRFDNHVQIFPAGRVAFSAAGGSLIINGKPYILVRSIADLKKAIKTTPTGRFALADNYDAASNGVYGFPPIRVFTGTLEGMGNTISNLSVNSDRQFVGFIGESRSEIRDIRLENANVVGSLEDAQIGTLVGALESGIIYNCSATGIANGTSNGETREYTGGLVGYARSYSRIIRSRANVSVSGITAGGLIGVIDDAAGMSQSFATGPVSGSAYAGGLVGANGNFVTTTDSYALGTVSSNLNAGGLAGEEAYKTETSYAAGLVQTPGNAGGVFGYVLGTSAGHNYWDMDTSGTNQGCGELNFADCNNIVGLTDAQLKSGLPAGFDPDVWTQDPSINNGYPYLIANPPP